MYKHLEVREFDRIIYSPNPIEGYKNIDNEEDFKNLLTFIREFRAKENTSDALEFLSIGFKADVGDYITIKNYVGLIELKNGFQIEILPKIAFNDNEKDRTKQIFLKMLKSLQEFNSKVFNFSNINIDKFNLYEVFIAMYLQEVISLLKKGIKSSYINIEDNIPTFRGKLIVKDQIKYNLAHKERFCVSFDEFSPNRPENRLIKSTLLKLNKLSTQNENKKQIKMILNSFEGIEASNNIAKDFSRVSISRSKEYEMLMIWSKVFLLNKSFTAFTGSTISRALLFPMEKVFESFVATKIKKELIENDCSVSSQDHAYYLFDRPSKFALVPDIVIRRPAESGPAIVLDTKWKRLNRSFNYGISQADMYQMYVYSKKYKAPVIWVLYPWSDEAPADKNSFIEFITDHDDNVKINIYFLDIVNIEESIKLLTQQL